jgi:hypothetical protein
MKRVSFSLILAFHVLLTAWPSFGHEIELRRVLKARTSGELTRLVVEYDKFRRLQSVCEAQLRALRVPGACFELMTLSSDTAKRENWLEGLCIARVEISRDWRELEAALKSKHLPLKCRNVALRREADLQYGDQAERPAEVFARMMIH